MINARPWPLLGGSASRPPEEATARGLPLAGECSRLLAEVGVRSPGEAPSSSDVTVADVRGPGHSLASAEGKTAAELAMRSEGLMTDPVYTAKALSLVSRCCGAGTVIFWHTGGILDVTAAAIGRADQGHPK